jgi:hypothetical protein
MRKEPASNLDAYVDRLDTWFDADKLSYKQVRQRLKKLGYTVSIATLARWHRVRQAGRLQQRLLEEIAQAGECCKEIEQQFSKNPAPAIETLIKLHRLLALKLSTGAQETPALVRLVATLMKPLLDWSRLEEQRKQRELDRQKEHEEAKARETATSGGSDAHALQPDTLKKIERELKLL